MYEVYYGSEGTSPSRNPVARGAFHIFSDWRARIARSDWVIPSAAAGHQGYHRWVLKQLAGQVEREARMESSGFREAERALESGGEQAVFDVLAQTFMQDKDY